MKKAHKETIKESTKVKDGIVYTYILGVERSLKVASFNMPLYSIEVIMAKNGKESRSSTGEIFSDIGKALVFFEKLSENFATPIDLPYIMEDCLPTV